MGPYLTIYFWPPSIEGLLPADEASSRGDFQERIQSRYKMRIELPLNAAGAALGKRPHLLQRSHGSVAWIRRKQSAVSPTEPHGLFRRSAAQQAVEKTRSKTVAAADAIEDV